METKQSGTSDTKFNSERWDVNLIINNDIPHALHERLFALYLLWRGRANDIIDRRGHTPESDQYELVAQEFNDALTVIFRERMH